MSYEKTNIIVPIAISNRHIHLTKTDLGALFGTGYELNKRNDLSQIGQFAAEETIKVAGPNGQFEKVRIVGPVRAYTQLEVSKTDATILGINPPISYGGGANNPAEVTLVGPVGKIKRSCAVMAMRHLHCSLVDATRFGLKEKDIVSLKIIGKSGFIFDNVVVRTSPDFVTEIHLDTDEANAAGMTKGSTSGILW